MKALSPHDPLDDLIAAALHGELTPEERIQFESRLNTNPAARAAYQEAQLMHDLLEKTHASAQPDPAFEQRIVSGVRRKIQDEERHRETAWESVLVLWRAVKAPFKLRYLVHHVSTYIIFCGFLGLMFMSVLFSLRNHVTSVFSTISSPLAYAGRAGGAVDHQTRADTAIANPSHAQQQSVDLAQAEIRQPISKSTAAPQQFGDANNAFNVNSVKIKLGKNGKESQFQGRIDYGNAYAGEPIISNGPLLASDKDSPPPPAAVPFSGDIKKQQFDESSEKNQGAVTRHLPQNNATAWDNSNLALPGNAKVPDKTDVAPATKPTDTTETSRKLIRNAELELEVKSFPAAMDQITALTKAAGGYVNTSNSQKGGNGKLQGTVVVKVLPQNLDAFLLKLRELGQITNQAVKTDDVTKDYYDTQARLENSRKMETQLQELLKRENGKVSDLLQVERELGRVRGEIEQMQGTLKVYDFQVAYATVTMQLREKDLNQAAAYLLKEQDTFSLFATDVEATFQKARQSADDFKAQVLAANLNHNSGSDVSAELVVMVAPDQIEPFLAQIRGLGRVSNFTRETQRVAKDGGDSTQPADQTLTEKDKVQVRLSIRSDDETRKQVALTVVTPAVDDALDKAKAAAQAGTGAQILNSSLNKTPQGQSTGQLSVRVPGKNYHALLDSFRALGRTASFSLQRDDSSDANGDDAPVIVSLALTDDDTPLQNTEISMLAAGVDALAQQLKKNASAAGVEVKASSFERQPDGTEMARMTFRLPMGKYPAFVENLKKIGKVESLTVRRDDRPDQALTSDDAPAEINLSLHNQRDLVPDDNGLWATLRQTFGEGAGALFGSVRTIGVLLAFIAPWFITIVIAVWLGRRIYIWRKK